MAGQRNHQDNKTDSEEVYEELEHQVSGGASRYNRFMESAIQTGLRLWFKFRFRTNVSGFDNMGEELGKSDRNMMVANHVTMLDALAVVAMVPKEHKPAFAIYSGTYKNWMSKWWTRPFLRHIELFPINTGDAGSIKDLTRLGESGRPVFIFPEGRLTRTGTIMKTYPGAATVADKMGATIHPLHLKNFEFPYLGRRYLHQYPRKLFPKLGITALPATKLDIPEEVKGKARREAQHARLEKIMHEIPLAGVKPEDTIISALHDTAYHFGYGRPILDYFNAPEIAPVYSLAFTSEEERDAFRETLSEEEKRQFATGRDKNKAGGNVFTLSYDDETRQMTENTVIARALESGAEVLKKARVVHQDEDLQTMNYQKLLAGIYALGEKLRDRTEELSMNENGEIESGMVGVMILNGASSIAPLALQAYNRVPAMMNVAEDLGKLLSCAETAKLETIITSRTMIELMGIEDKVEELRTNVPEGHEPRKIVYLEDLKKEVSGWDKFKGLLRARGILSRPEKQKRMHGQNPAQIIFTSGSTGAPKAVVNSHENILYNIAQIRSVHNFNPSDSVLNGMPGFHAFGNTGGLLMPLLHGVRSLQYPNPIDKNMPEIIYQYFPTIIYGTNKFLDLYDRASKDDKNFLSVEQVIAGGEKIKRDIIDRYAEKYGIAVYESYGMTEASPAISMNVKCTNRWGTVGKTLPGITERFQEVAGYENGGVLSIKGKNVAMGYILNNQPGLLQPFEGGWLDTGDIVVKDGDGFNKIVGRTKRLAVIAGENVGLDEIEHIAASISPDFEYASIARKDDTKGEATVLFTTNPDITRDKMVSKLRESDANANLLKLPGNTDIIYVEGELPKLGIGKVDYMALERRFNGQADGTVIAVEEVAVPANDSSPEGDQPPAAQPG